MQALTYSKTVCEIPALVSFEQSPVKLCFIIKINADNELCLNNILFVYYHTAVFTGCGAYGVPGYCHNHNSAEAYPADSYEKMIERAGEKRFNFPYLHDDKQEIYKIYGATKTPHVYVLQKKAGKYRVEYMGAIDNNYRDAEALMSTMSGMQLTVCLQVRVLILLSQGLLDAGSNKKVIPVYPE